MDEFLIVIFSISCGAIGYLIATFWVQSILKYREIKAQIIADLIFYDNAISPVGLNEEMKQRVLDRESSNRKRAAQLTASYISFPRFYRMYLHVVGERPDKATFEFIGLSNTHDIKEARGYINQIQNFLRIKPKVV